MIRLLQIILIPVACIVIGATGALAQQCPQNAHYSHTTQEGNVEIHHCKCDPGYKSRDGECRLVGGDPKCVQQAGERLNKEREEGCERVIGQCFQNNKFPLSVVAIRCVRGCRSVASCAIDCGIAGWATGAVVETCLDERNACFESALAKHSAAVKACKGG